MKTHWLWLPLVLVWASIATGAPPASVAAPAADAGLENVSILVDGYEVFARVVAEGEVAPMAVQGSLLAPDGLVRAVAHARTQPDGSFAIAFLTTGTGFRRPIAIRPGDTVVLQVTGPVVAERAVESAAAVVAAREVGSAAAVPGAQGVESWAPVSAGRAVESKASAIAGRESSSTAFTPAASILAVPPTRLLVRPITAVPDQAADRLSGTAPAGAALTVTATGPDGRFVPSRRVTAGSDGRWSVDYAGVVDLAPGAQGAAFYFEGQIVFQRAWVVPRVSLAVGAAAVPLVLEPGAVVGASLLSYGKERAKGQVVAWNGTAGLVLFDPAGNPAVLGSGDALQVRLESGEVVSRTIPLTTVDVDATADAVTGMAEPGQRLRVSVDDQTKEATAGADGNWKADFTGWTDLTVATEVAIAFPEVPDAVLKGFVPGVTDVDPLEAVVSGRGVAGTSVRVALEDAGGNETALAEGLVGPEGIWRLAVRTDAGQPVAWDGRLALSVALMGDVKRLAAPLPLNVSADAGRRAVNGVARPGSRIQVGLGGNGELSQAVVTQTVDAAADGHWEAQFAPDTQMPPGTPVTVRLMDPEGYATFLNFPVFRVQAQVAADRVRVEGAPRLAANLELERDGDLVATGGCSVARTSCEARLKDPAGHAVTMRPGDALTVLGGDAGTAALDVFHFDAHIDRNGADVVGEAPANDSVRIVFANDQGASPPMGGRSSTDRAGVFDFEVSTSQWSLLVPGLAVDVYHPRPGGHELWARGVLEVARVTPGDAWVRGMAEPGYPVTAWLSAAATNGTLGFESMRLASRASDTLSSASRGFLDMLPLASESVVAPLASGSAVADADGRVAIELRDAADRPVAPRAGQTVHFLHNRAEHVVEVASLDAWGVGAAGAVAGLTAPDLEVRAFHTVLAAPGEPDLVVVSGTADRFGTFSLPAPPAGRALLVRSEVVAYLPGGDELRRPLSPDARTEQIFLPRVSRP